MKYDCGFTKDTNWFRYRTGGILVHDGRMLMVRSKTGGYLYMIGGGVHMGETSETCIKREFLEETGINVEIDHMAAVVENFFKGHGSAIDGFDCHTIEFYYCLCAGEDKIKNCKKFTDEGEELVWIPITEIERTEIKPVFINKRIGEIINTKNIIHIVEETDRCY